MGFFWSLWAQKHHNCKNVVEVFEALLCFDAWLLQDTFWDIQTARKFCNLLAFVNLRSIEIV